MGRTIVEELGNRTTTSVSVRPEDVDDESQYEDLSPK